MARTKGKTGGQLVQIAIEGEMTIARAEGLREVMLPPLVEAQEIEIDLSRVSEIDSAGLQLMMAAKLEAWARGKTLRFVGHSKAVVDMLDLCELGAFFGDQVVISSALH